MRRQRHHRYYHYHRQGEATHLCRYPKAAATKVTVARIGANPGVDIPLVEAATASAERMTAELGNGVQMALQNVEKLQQDMAMLHDQTAGKIDNLLNVMAAPKRIIRGPDGKAVGVEIAV